MRIRMMSGLRSPLWDHKVIHILMLRREYALFSLRDSASADCRKYDISCTFRDKSRSAGLHAIRSRLAALKVSPNCMETIYDREYHFIWCQHLQNSRAISEVYKVLLIALTQPGLLHGGQGGTAFSRETISWTSLNKYVRFIAEFYDYFLQNISASKHIGVKSLYFHELALDRHLIACRSVSSDAERRSM